MLLHILLEKRIPLDLNEESDVFSGAQFFGPERSIAQITHVGAEAYKVLCVDGVCPSACMLEHYSVHYNLTASHLEALVHRLNPRYFFTPQLLAVVLTRWTHENQYLIADGRWNLIPLFGEGEPTFLGVIYLGDGWKISRRRIRNEADMRGEDAPTGSRVILAVR